MKEWKEFLARCQKEFGSDVVSQWMPKCTHFDAQNIYLQAKDMFQQSWFNEHIRPRLKGLVNQNQKPIKIHILSTEKTQIKKKPKFFPLNFSQDPLDKQMLLEHFIVSEENLVIQKLFKEPFPFNPIYLYGPKGVGKTHLLMGAAHYFKQMGKTVFFVNASTFTDHVVQAIRSAQMKTFRKIYRTIDVLIVDDIEIFSKKSATQEEFFHTFNALHTIGRFILLSSCIPPSQLQEIEPRLISRFEWGILLQVHPSNKKKIIKKKAELWGISLKEDLINWLLQTFTKDPILALQALILRTKGNNINIKSATKLLEDLIQKEQKQTLLPEQIIKIVAAHYGITSEDILGKSQLKAITLPRQVAMYYCRKKLSLSFQKIGKVFGKDHSTVISSTKQIEKNLAENKLIPVDFPY